MADAPPRCVFADDCPQRRLTERRMVESMEKYRKETTEKFDLCDGTHLNTVTVVEGDRINDGDWNFRQTKEKFRTQSEGEILGKRTPCEAPKKPSHQNVAKDRVLVATKDIHPCNYRKEEVQEESAVRATTDFPVCEYRPPRPASSCTHVSERTVSMNEASRHSSLHSKTVVPVPAPRTLSRTEVQSDLRSSTPKQDFKAVDNHVTRSPLRYSVQDTRPSPSPRRSISSAPPTDGVSRIRVSDRQDRQKMKDQETQYYRIPNEIERPRDPSTNDVTRRSTRSTMRTSSRSAQSQFFRVQSVSGSVRSRPQVFRDEPSPRTTPEPIGDSHPKREKEIPVYRERAGKKSSAFARESFDKPGSPRYYDASQIREEMVTRETFERVTTTRKMWPSTYV